MFIVSPIFINAQSGICTQTTCTGFLNSDNYQIYSAIRNQTISAVTSGTISLTGTASVNQVTAAMVSVASSVTTSGAVTAGAISILFETSDDFSGTIDGLRFLGNGFLSYPNVPSGRYPEIPYVINAGTLYIRKMTN